MLNFFYLVIKLSWHGFRVWRVNPANSRLTRKFFFPIQLSNFHDMNPIFDGLTQLIQIFFLFLHVGFFSLFFFAFCFFAF